MQKDIGRYTITISRNNRYCYGLGFEKYPILDIEVGYEAQVVAWVTRLDFLFFFINFTRYPKVAWRDNNPE
jgi:hypothetical protein